jgi:predicted nucleotidyltransferase
MREQLLSHLPWFVSAVAKLPGVRRIALLGSITTNKQNPKDIDFLVVVENDLNLEPLARLGRKIKGRAQNMNRGADIFLADVNGKYIGRTCSWRECRPGKRMSCDALNCGKRHYLHDDLKSIQLSEDTVRAAIEIWPVLERRPGLPDDLEKVLEQLEAGLRS